MLHKQAPHTPAELEAIEQQTGLRFAGYVNVDRILTPLFVKLEHLAERVRIIRTLNAA